MPVYQFRAEDGKTLDIELSRDELMDLPLEGKSLTLVRDGVRYRRVSGSGREGTPMALTEFRPFRTVTVPKGYPGFKHDTDGTCVVETRSQMETYRKQQGLEWS